MNLYFKMMILHELENFFVGPEASRKFSLVYSTLYLE